MSSSSIRAQIRQVQRTLEIYKDRKSNMEKTQKKLNSKFDDNVSTAQQYNSSLTANLYEGLSGRSLRVSRLCEEIDDVKEKPVWNDRNLSSADDYMDREISRCRSEISRLEAELSSLQAQLQAALETEAKARLEELASLLGN